SADFKITVVDRDLDMPLEGVRIREADSGFETFTDQDGNCTLQLSDNLNRAVVIAELIGYEPRKQLVTDFSKPLIIELLMEGILEGQELVVEVEAIGETDAEVGVSTVIEKETIQAAAKMGLIEDVMNAVKILPGVTYSGGFGSQMSVRGGDPSGLTAVMDGFVTKYPNHWGGAYSIFNPNIVESIKFSPGIFSTKYGEATSALLEVNTVDPTDGLKFSGILSTSTIEAFSQIPFGKNKDFGLLTGFRLTNYDIALKTVEATGRALDIEELTSTVENISLAPYIYDGYLKTQYAPAETFKWYLNGFWGNDGIGVENIEIGDKTKEIANGFAFFYTNTDLFINTGVKILPNKDILLSFMAGYEYWIYELDGTISEEGYREYSNEFISEFTPISQGYEIYTDSNFKEDSIKQSVQGRFDIDWSINDNYLLQFGLGTNVDFSSGEGKGNMWTIVQEGIPEYKSISYESSGKDTKTISSFIYTNLNAIIVPETLKMDIGVRSDHSYFTEGDDFTLNTYPDISPRVNFTITPNIGNDFFKENSFSLGSGIFSKNPFSVGGLREDLGIKDFELIPEKSLTSVVGWETNLPLDYRFKIEGYYKYIYDRFYYIMELEENNTYTPKLYFDGYGHVGGGDFLLEKKLSRYLDGLLSYTYVYARYNEPNDDARDDYYPYYHRFNTLNLLMNFKPTSTFTFTTKLSFATGNPKEKDGETTMFAAYVKDREGNDQIAEMYSRTSYYSDTLRSNYSLPLDLKASWHNYYKNTKYEWEFYIALQDALAPLIAAIQPSESVQTSKWDGDSEEAPSSGFSFPIPSIGFSMSF
ncbi:MAG: TonB-dependent receptor, partial [Spirochaetales bacterium]|nr:TonB-dependent receptor [Spirochaetales bacterium]